MIQKVFARADGSKSIGAGHLVRSDLILRNLKRCANIDVKLFTKSTDGFLAFLDSGSYNLVEIPDSDYSGFETKFFVEACRVETPDAVILDLLNPAPVLSGVATIREREIKTAVIVDNSDRTLFSANLILNGNPNQEKGWYQGEKGDYIVGPRYFIMDERYNHVEAKTPRGIVRTVLLTLGGTDHNDLIFRCIDAFQSLPITNLHIPYTKMSGHQAPLIDCASRSRVPITLYGNTSSLFDLFGECDLAITAGGNSLFERIASRVPGGAICQLSRQTRISKKFQELGVNVHLGYGPEMKSEEIEHKLHSLVEDTEAHQKQIEHSVGIPIGDGLSLFLQKFLRMIR